MADKKQEKTKDIFDKIKSGEKIAPTPDIFDKVKEEEYSPNTPLASKLIGGGAALGGLYLAKKGAQALGRYANAPKALINPIDAQFKNWQMQHPELMGTAMEDMPGFIQQKIAGVTKSKTDAITKMNQQATVAQKTLGQKLANFDEAILKTPTKNLANTISSNYNDWASSGYNAYENFLNQGQAYLEAKGETFTGREVKNLLNGVENTAENAGVLPKDLKGLKEFNSNFDPNAKVSVKQLKGILKNLKNEDFTGDIAHSIQENEGIFLSKKIPKEVVNFDEVNTDYQQFAKTRAKLVKIGANKGLVDTQGLNSYLKDYLNSSFDSGIDSLMANITKEGKMTLPIKGAEGLFKELQALKLKKNAIKTAISNVKVNQAKKDLMLTEALKKEVDALIPWRQTAEQLLSRKGAIQAKYPLRTQGWKGILKTLGVGIAERGVSKALYRPMANAAMQVVPAIPEAMNYMLDKDYRKKFKEKVSPGQMQIMLRELAGEDNVI